MNKGLEKFYELVEAFESLPTIGKKKSALDFSLSYCYERQLLWNKIAHSIENALKTLQKCSRCVL